MSLLFLKKNYLDVEILLEVDLYLEEIGYEFYTIHLDLEKNVWFLELFDIS